MSSIIINPNEPLKTQSTDPPLVIEQTEDGSARLVHKETGAFIAFFNNGTILMRDALGSGIQTLETGDILVGAMGNVINFGKNIAFRGNSPDEIAWVFNGDNNEQSAATFSMDESSESVSTSDSDGSDKPEVGTNNDDGGAGVSS